MRAEETPNIDEQPAAAAIPEPSPAPLIVPPPPARAILPGEPGSTEDKRIAGILPNYATADSMQPFVPLTVAQKWKIAFKDTANFPSYVMASVFAGISQGDDSNQEFGRGMKGYARRYAAGVADQDMGNFISEAVYPTLLHQDPRYFRKGTGSVKGRLLWSLERIVIAKTDSGGSTFNFPEWLGNGTVASLGNLYYPNERGFDATMQRMFTQVGTDAVSDVLKEFWPDLKRHFTKKRND